MSEFKEKIKKDKNYKGQIVFELERNKTPSLVKEAYDEEEKFQVLWAFKNNFFKHQNEALNKLLEGKNVLLLSSYYSGRSTLSVIFALKKIFDEIKSVLYITPDEFIRKNQINYLKKILEELNYEWLLEPYDISEENIKKSIFPKLFVTDIQSLHFKLLPNHNLYPLFWSSLGLIVLDDFILFSGNLASNSFYVFRRLNKIINENEGKPQYLILSRPFQNAESYVKKLLKVDFEVIIEDSRGANSATINFWVPPLSEAKLTYEQDINKMRIYFKRNSVYEEAISLAIKGVLNGLNTVVFYSDIPLSKEDEVKYNNRIVQEVKNSKKNEYSVGKWFLGNNLDILTFQLKEKNLEWKDINLIITVGFNGPLSSLRDEIIHLGADKCEIYILLPQLPYYQFYINHPEEIIPPSGVEGLKSEEHYTLFSMNEEDREIMKKHLLFEIYEKNSENDDWPQDIIQELIDEKLIKIENNFMKITERGKERVREIMNFEGKDLYSSFDQAFKVYENNEKLLLLIDPVSVVNYFYPNSFVEFCGKRYMVKEVDVERRKVNLSPTDLFELTSPLPSFEIKSEEILKTLSINKKLNFKLGYGKILFTLSKYKSIEYFEISIQENLRELKPELKLETNVAFLKIEGFSDKNLAHTFAHLFFTALHTRFKWQGWELPKFYIKENTIYFFSSSIGVSIFENLMNENILKDLLERMFCIVKECPSTSGCPACLYIFECTESNCISSLNKEKIIQLTGELINKPDLSIILQEKYKGIENEGKLGVIRDNVIEILNRKAGMKIEKPYHYLFFPQQIAQNFPSLLGVCGEGNVYVRRGLREEDLIEVIAHEYTHNWQLEKNLNERFEFFNCEDIDDERNILFAGRIFIEGQAMYGEVKVLDYYGLKDKISVEPDSEYPLYSAGLRLMLFLEEEFGLIGLLDILKNGKIDKKDVNKEILEKWYKKSGVYDIITQAGREIQDKGGLICLTPAYLNKPLSDLQRVSYHLFAISRRKEKETIGELLDTRKENIIWKNLREIIKEVRGSYPLEDEIPCKKCSQRYNETLEDVCILFKSINYAKKIIEEL